MYTFVVALQSVSKECCVVEVELYHVECVPVIFCERKDVGVVDPTSDHGKLDG